MTPAAVQASAPAPARYAVLADPMRLDVGPGDMRPVPPEATFAELAAAHDVGARWLCAIVAEDMAADGSAGAAYLPREWWHTCPRPGDTVVFHRRAQGGNGTRSALQIVVAIAAAWATAGASSYFSAGSFAASAAGAAAGLATTAVGNALINALVPLDKSNLPGTMAAIGNDYNVALQGNRARLGQPLPVLYGHTHEYPDFACEAYQVFLDNQQYYHAVLCCTVGMLDVLRVSIAGVPVAQMRDVEALIIGPGQADGETLDAQTLVKTNIINCPGVSSHELKELKRVGPFVAVPRGRQAIKLRVDIGFPRGLDTGLSISWVMQYIAIDGFERIAGDWTELATETYSTARNTPWRQSYEYAVPAGRYMFRLWRTDIRTANAYAAHDVYLIGLAAELDEPGIDASIPATYIVLKLRASEQLSVQSQLKVRVLSTRMLPVWDGSTWSAPVSTRAIDPVVADILRNADYGRSLPDDQLELDGLHTLQGVWAARFDKFDGIFNETTDVDTAVRQVLRVGRAVPIVRGSRYTFVRDEVDTEPVAHFSVRNIRGNTFALMLAVPERDQITALDVTYLDATVWDYVTLTVQYVGASEPEPFISYVGDTPPAPYSQAEHRARLRLPGVLGPAHCAREASYILANMLFRRSTASYRAHLDGLLPAYLAPVRVQHDVPRWGQAGDVVDWDPATRTVTTSEPLDWTAGGAHYMRLQDHTGGEVQWAVTAGAAPDEAVAADALGFTPRFASALRERTRYIFGPSTSAGALCRVKTLTPRGKRDVEHLVVLEDARVHTADEPWLPVGGIDPDPPISDGSSDPGEGTDVYVVRILDREVSQSYSGASPPSSDLIAAITLNANGTASQTSFGGTPVALPNEWLQGGAVSGAIASLYEVRATTLSGALASGTVGSWLNLGSGPYTWRVEVLAGNFGTPEWVGRIEIRDVATATIQDSADITLSITAIETGGA